jgi:hypothetical protein
MFTVIIRHWYKSNYHRKFLSDSVNINPGWVFTKFLADTVFIGLVKTSNFPFDGSG